MVGKVIREVLVVAQADQVVLLLEHVLAQATDHVVVLELVEVEVVLVAVHEVLLVLEAVAVDEVNALMCLVSSEKLPPHLQ
jgi:hypothetical protein